MRLCVGKRSRAHAAARYIQATLASSGYAPLAQGFVVDGVSVRNIKVEVPGTSRTSDIVVGAHYDSVRGSPGANDNGSGVAAVLELARRWRDRRPADTVRFVFFVNEETPFFKSADMGSLRSFFRGKRYSFALAAGTIPDGL
jgi:acetylornithine deacetylase/succinyl-diaminopimelate desuccinylase-like protein